MANVPCLNLDDVRARRAALDSSNFQNVFSVGNRFLVSLVPVPVAFGLLVLTGEYLEAYDTQTGPMMWVSIFTFAAMGIFVLTYPLVGLVGMVALRRRRYVKRLTASMVVASALSMLIAGTLVIALAWVN